MTIAPHALAGAALAATTMSPAVAFLLGFVSHFALDAIPHFEPGTVVDLRDKEWPRWVYIWSAIEMILTIAIIYFLFQNRWDFNIIAWGALGGLSVDLVEHTPLKILRPLPFFKQLHWLHENIHLDIDRKYWYWSVFFTMITLGGSLWYLLRF